MIEHRSAVIGRILALPVIKSGMSLVVSTGATAGLGLVFWMLASRLFSEEDFGVGSTTVTTMMMLADVSLLGLRTGLVRFLPTAGGGSRSLIVGAYGLAALVAAGAGLAFLLGLEVWAPGLGELTEGRALAVFFVVATATWAIFMLEDSALVGLHRAPWVPVENAVFGVAKIVLLVPMSRLSPTFGLFLAWALPVFVVVIAVNLLLSRKSPSRVGHAKKRSFPAMFRYSIADWTASFARLASYGIPPLLVLSQLGKTAAGHFNVAWIMAFALFLVGTNIADAVLVESSYEADQLNANSRHAILLGLGITVPAALIGIAIAPVLLTVFQPGVAANSVGVLRVLLLAAVPNVVAQVLIGRMRAQERMRMVIAVEWAMASVVLGLAVVLLRNYGLIGVGYAWLVGLGATLSALALIELASTRRSRRSRPKSLRLNEKVTDSREELEVVS